MLNLLLHLLSASVQVSIDTRGMLRVSHSITLQAAGARAHLPEPMTADTQVGSKHV